jgi:hypothetical protein
MTEIIRDLETTIASPDGHDYYVQVVGEQLASGTWEVWLEFVPLDDDLDLLLTNTETTQLTREDVVGWSEALTGTGPDAAGAPRDHPDLRPESGRQEPAPFD